MQTGGRYLRLRLVALDNLLDFILTCTIHLQAENQKKRFDVVLAVFASNLFLILVLLKAVLVCLAPRVQFYIGRSSGLQQYDLKPRNLADNK